MSQSPGGSSMTLSLPANRRVGHVILGLDRLANHVAQMDREPELKIIRRAFAKQVMAASGIRDPRVEAAFAAVAREDFLGARAVADRALGRLSHDAGSRPGLPVHRRRDRHLAGAQPEQRPALASRGADRRRRAAAGRTCSTCRRLRRLLHGDSRGAGRRARCGRRLLFSAGS